MAVLKVQVPVLPYKYFGELCPKYVLGQKTCTSCSRDPLEKFSCGLKGLLGQSLCSVVLGKESTDSRILSLDNQDPGC